MFSSSEDEIMKFSKKEIKKVDNLKWNRNKKTQNAQTTHQLDNTRNTFDNNDPDQYDTKYYIFFS